MKVFCFGEAQAVLDAVEQVLVSVPGLAPRTVTHSSGVWLSLLQTLSPVALCDQEDFYLSNAGL